MNANRFLDLIEICFSIQEGKFVVEDLTVQREKHWKSCFDLHFNRLEINYLESLMPWLRWKERLTQPIVVDKLVVEGLIGSGKLIQNDPDKLNVIVSGVWKKKIPNGRKEG